MTIKNKKIKIVTLVGTRPEIIRLSETIKELDRYTDHILVHTGQNYDYELSQVFFDDLKIRKPDYFLDASGITPVETVGNVIKKTDAVLKKEEPEAFLVLGDTNSCMGAYAAKRRKIPIFHMEAGNRSYDFRVPEEINRRLVDHMSDINMPYSELARNNLLKEGIPSDRIIKTGSPIFEVISVNKKKVLSSNIIKKLKLQKNRYFVLSLHREENVDSVDNFERIIKILSSIVDLYKFPIIFSCHPRTNKQIVENHYILPKEVKIVKPLGLFDYLNLQMNAFCVLSDSGTISEESSILKFPAINMRETHERPEAMDRGNVIMTGLNEERVMQAIKVLKQQQNLGYKPALPEEYSYDDVSKKVVRIILSYVDYIKRTVWQENL